MELDTIAVRSVWDGAAEPDCLHWLPGALDLEPEQCFCLRCGEPVPCPSCNANPTPKHKESTHA